MYIISLAGKVIHDPSMDNCYVIDPKIEYNENHTGLLTFELPAGHKITPKHEDVVEVTAVPQAVPEVIPQPDPFFIGVVTSAKKSFYGSYLVEVGSPEVLLQHTVIAPTTRRESVAAHLKWLVAAHNEQRQKDEFHLYTLPELPTANVEWEETEYKTSYELYEGIKEHVWEQTGHYLVVGLESGWYVPSIWSSPASNQTIEYGVNLLDIEQRSDFAALKTVLLPLGASDSNGERLTIAPPGGDIYVRNQAAIEAYGVRQAIKIYDTITDPSTLRQRAEADLSAMSDPITSLDLKAIDLNIVDSNVNTIEVGDKIRVVSRPHGIDKSLPVVSKLLDLTKPENSEIVLGAALPCITDVSTGSSLDRGGDLSALAALSDRTTALESDNTTNKSDISSLKTRTSSVESKASSNQSLINAIRAKSNGWSQMSIGGTYFDSSGSTGKLEKDGLGNVDFRLVVKSKTSISATTSTRYVAKIPYGYRPSGRIALEGYCATSSGYVRASINGANDDHAGWIEVRPSASVSQGAWFTFAGMWRTDQ